MMEPAAIESVSQSTFSIKAFTAHPYKNLVVSNWDKKKGRKLSKMKHQIPNDYETLQRERITQ